MRIVFDLDGTLADVKHREHFITGERRKNWGAFFEACDADRPIVPAITVLNALARAHDLPHVIEIWSGRGEGHEGSVRRKTIRWLARYTSLMFCDNPPPEGIWFLGTGVIHVRMRKHRDYTADDELKRGWLIKSRNAGRAPDLVFDDRQRVVDMWRAEGIPCFQVAVGDF